MLRQHAIAQMSFEDQRSHALRLHHTKLQELDRARLCSNNRNQSHSQQTKERNTDENLSMSKPLVTEIMEFFYNKEKESKYEQSLEEIVDEL